eukprot:TRINITY_DN1039_c0_g2_i1.p1 TRINITY_DN1039_c0_g2~~TRINITY_DN1039_c0_g2_i1.p1  ORF type:complete len:192 (+),score=19.14 TRINITY_DN1039_c0_g2_i1:37-576(+)
MEIDKLSRLYPWSQSERKVFRLYSPSPNSSSNSELDWDDMVYRYDSNRDTFTLYFIRTDASMITSTTNLTPSVNALIGSDGKIMCLEFNSASKTLGCHLFEYPCVLDGWPYCALTWFYDKEVDALNIYFVDQKDDQSFCDNECSAKGYSHSIIFDREKSGRYTGIEILSACKLLKKKKP